MQLAAEMRQRAAQLRCLFALPPSDGLIRARFESRLWVWKVLANPRTLVGPAGGKRRPGGLLLLLFLLPILLLLPRQLLVLQEEEGCG